MSASEFDLLDLAVPYALDAVTDTERADIEQRLAKAPRVIAEAFRTQVTDAREAMAAVSVTTAVQPPAALRDRVLGAEESSPESGNRWRHAVVVVAAFVLAAGAFAAGWLLRPAPTAEPVLSAPDVRAVSTPLDTGGTATIVYSRQRGVAVVVLERTAPGYHLWLIKDGVPTPAGAVGDARTVSVSDIGAATALGITVGSQPADLIAEVELP